MSITTGILQYGTGSHLTSSEEANAIATDLVTAGIVGAVTNTNGVAPTTGGFGVSASGSGGILNIAAGVAYVTGTPTSQGSQTLRVKNSAQTTVTCASNASGSTKYDHVYIKLDPTNMANPNTAADNVATIVISRSSNALTDDGTPPTYGFKLAVATVANGFGTLTNANVADKRTQAGATAAGTSTAVSAWNSLGYTPNSVTTNGNHSYSLLFNSVDLTSTLSAGMRFRTTRTVAAPTQCTSLNGSTQYYSKTSPAGMTFTNNFVVSAWVKLTSYGNYTVASRWNGTSGWGFEVDSSGRVTMFGTNAASANFSNVTSYQSIPLNKWVHISAQLDMSTFTASTTTSYVMIDGIDVPASVARAGTNPTALIQAGNLEIGSRNGGTQFFPGKIAQVAIYSAKVTQSAIQATISQGLLGTETNLISAYSFNNSVNDLNTTNANNLTANGSAVATNADSPFGGQADGTISSALDYAIVQKVTFSTNTTVVVQVPEGCTIPASGGVSAVSYSSSGVPYGFPKQKGKWQVTAYDIATATQATPTVSVYYNVGSLQLNVPIGEWNLGFKTLTGMDRSVAGRTDVAATLSTANNSASDQRLMAGQGGGNANVFGAGQTSAEAPVSLSAATIYYHNIAATSSVSSGNLYLFGSGGAGPFGTCVIYADNAFL